jgi:transmembrane sensor
MRQPFMPDNFSEPEDLLSDESFLAWYFKTGKADDSTWDQWMAGNPERTLLVKQAVDLLQVTLLREPPVPMEQVQKAEARLLDRLVEDITRPEVRPEVQADLRPLYSFRRRSRMVAAAVLLILATGLLITVRHRDSQQEWKTQYGQIDRRQLPDGTVVTMNAHSQLRYKNDWATTADREVWIDGEAFFHVSKTPQKSRFIVHAHYFDVIVTGTQFNIVSRQGTGNVLLKEGSVTLRLHCGKEMKMQPGDFVALLDTGLQKRNVQPDSVMAWQDQKLIFDKTPLRDLVTILNNQYGVHVQLEGRSLGDSTISGILPDNNLDILLQMLKATSDFDVLREGDQITIKAHSGPN